MDIHYTIQSPSNRQEMNQAMRAQMRKENACKEKDRQIEGLGYTNQSPSNGLEMNQALRA